MRGVAMSLHDRTGASLSTRRLQLLLADDHETVRQGLRLLFEERGNIDVVRDVADGESAVEAARTLKPDVVVLDLSMPGMSGLAAARVIKLDVPDTAIVVLTRHSEHAYVQEVLANGASGYVLKQSPFDELLRAVTAAASGMRYIDRAIAPLETAEQPLAATPAPVSEREMTVLQLSAAGKSNKDIASALGIAVKTVEVHKASAMRKLQLRDRADVIRFAVVKGWLQDP
jgi:two-component system, NarL family, response regulator NreC